MDKPANRTTPPAPKGTTLSPEVSDLFRRLLGQSSLSPTSETFEDDAKLISKARKELGLA